MWFLTNPEALEVTKLDVSIIGLIKQINDAMVLQMNRNLSEWDLTFSQMQILRVLHKNGGAASQKYIETSLGVTHPTVVGLVTRLEKNGFVETHHDDADRRRKIVTLTPKAGLHRQSLESAKADAEKRLLSGFSAEDLSSLEKYLMALRANACEKESKSSKLTSDERSIEEGNDKNIT